MGLAYIELLENREEIMFQLQTHAAAGDERVREQVRADFMVLHRPRRRASAAPAATRSSRFMGRACC